MASKNASPEPPPDIIVIGFIKDGQRYRMRVAKVHVHPGERDRFEVQGKDMFGGAFWTDLPDGSSKVPSPEWIIRRALWHVHNQGLSMSNGLMVIDLGEV